MNFINKQTITHEQKLSLLKAEKATSEGNIALAETEYRRLISNKIKLPQVYSQLALICAQTNRITEAKALWGFALELSPNFPHALLGLGDICKFERNYNKAISYYQKAISSDPKIASAHLNLSVSYLQIGMLNESERSCLIALELLPNYIQAQDHLGQIYVTKGSLKQAESLYKKQLKENNQNIKALYSLGNIFKSQGKLEQAKSNYQKAFSLYPEYTQAHFTYASIHKYSDNSDSHISLMLEEYKKPNLPLENKIQLSFALAKAYEDLKNYTVSFTYLETGNRLRHAKSNYTIDSDKAFIENIKKVFTKENVENLTINSQTSKKPIFIIGMPRSGTTLVEKILASHSQVYGAGELEHFFKLSTANFLTEKTNYLFESLTYYSNESFENIGRSYLEHIELLTNEADFVTDKLPFNMLMLGFIRIAFPNAKIIHCVRNAKDNCLSIFKKNFTTDNYRFAYNLKTLGQFHKLYQSLMKHWHSNFPGAIYDVEYESLIKSPEKEIKNLIAACDLNWEESCLNFHQTDAVIKTASAYQVRQPIYDTSVGLWKEYEANITDLLDELELKY